jgi:hypothetical protein
MCSFNLKLSTVLFFSLVDIYKTAPEVVFYYSLFKHEKITTTTYYLTEIYSANGVPCVDENLQDQHTFLLYYN